MYISNLAITMYFVIGALAGYILARDNKSTEIITVAFMILGAFFGGIIISLGFFIGILLLIVKILNLITDLLIKCWKKIFFVR